MRVLFLALALVGNLAQAAPINLSCTGNQFIYRSDSPWFEQNPTRADGTIVVKVDPATKRISTKYLPHVGDKVLNLTVGEGHYGGSIRFNQIVDGQFLQELVIVVNRVTGEAESYVSVFDSDNKERIAVFHLFRGKCEALRTKF